MNEGIKLTKSNPLRKNVFVKKSRVFNVQSKGMISEYQDSNGGCQEYLSFLKKF
jgi:hypothetical protein